MDEQKRIQEWLGKPTPKDLIDLSQGSTQKWYDSIKEIPMEENVYSNEVLKNFTRESLEAELRRRDLEQGMRLFCWYCKESVSSELPEDAVFRAIAVCPECIEKQENRKEKTCTCNAYQLENYGCKCGKG